MPLWCHGGHQIVLKLGGLVGCGVLVEVSQSKSPRFNCRLNRQKDVYNIQAHSQFFLYKAY